MAWCWKCAINAAVYASEGPDGIGRCNGIGGIGGGGEADVGNANRPTACGD